MRALATIAVLAAALAGCDSGDGADDRRPAEREPPPPAVTPAELREHLVALQEIADRAGGTRAAGTPGDRASAEYVAARLREAGFRVRVEPVRFPWFELEEAVFSVGAAELRHTRDFQVLSYSASGRASGPLRSAGTGCDAADFAALGEGEIPLVERDECRFYDKARNATAAGAEALVVRTELVGTRGVPSGTLGVPGTRIPVVLADARVLEPGAEVELEVEAESGRRETQNVVAETPAGAGSRVIMAGGHLDSVAGGPGINDNGSGVAALIELAEALGPRPPGARVRLGFWGAEELGLIGSRAYVESLADAERERLAVYLNLDQVGSPNAVTEVYEDGAPAVEQLLRDAARGRQGGVEAGGASDHAPFREAGVPIGGLYTGASERGRGGRPRDPCYHLACDRLENVDEATLLGMARGAAEAVAQLSRRHR